MTHRTSRTARAARTRQRVSFAAAALLGCGLVAMFAWGNFEAPPAPGSILPLVVATIVAIVAIFLLVEGGMAAFEARRFERLERGEGVIARWTLDADAWRERLRERRVLDALPGALQTAPDLPDEISTPSIAIVVSDDAVSYGTEAWQAYHADWCIQASLDGLWLTLDWPAEETQTHVCRIPVAAGAEADAERVVRHFAAGPREVRA